MISAIPSIICIFRQNTISSPIPQPSWIGARRPALTRGASRRPSPRQAGGKSRIYWRFAPWSTGCCCLRARGPPRQRTWPHSTPVSQKVSGSLRLVPVKGRYALVSSAEGPLEQIAVEAVRSASSLLVTGHPDQIRLCGECGWMFYDTSRNHLRRWCSMKICGNRAKARRHYERERQKLSTAGRSKPKLHPGLRSE